MAFDPTQPSMTSPDWATCLGSIRENFRALRSGDAGVFAGQNESGYAAATAACFTMWNSSGGANYETLEVGSSRADADATRAAALAFFADLQTAGHKTLAAIDVYTDGATANQRGGQLRWSTKPNGSAALVERMRLDQAGTLAIGGVAPNASGGRTQVFEATPTQYQLGAWDTTAFAAGVGGGIAFGGKTTAAPAWSLFGALAGVKENAASGDNASALSFLNRVNGGALVERMRLASTGLLTFPAGGGVPEGSLSLSAVTTGDVSTARHGFLPTLPNDATKFFNGAGAWVVPSGGPLTAKTTADQSWTSNTVLAAITGLSVTLAAGVTYHFRADLYVETTGSTTPGIQVDLAGTATVTALRYNVQVDASSLTLGAGASVAVGMGTTFGGVVVGGQGQTVYKVTVTGTIVVNAGGTLFLRASQFQSNATATIVRRGASLLAFQL